MGFFNCSKFCASPLRSLAFYCSRFAMGRSLCSAFLFILVFPPFSSFPPLFPLQHQIYWAQNTENNQNRGGIVSNKLVKTWSSIVFRKSTLHVSTLFIPSELPVLNINIVQHHGQITQLHSGSAHQHHGLEAGPLLLGISCMQWIWAPTWQGRQRAGIRQYL